MFRRIGEICCFTVIAFGLGIFIALSFSLEFVLLIASVILVAVGVAMLC